MLDFADFIGIYFKTPSFCFLATDASWELTPIPEGSPNFLVLFKIHENGFTKSNASLVTQQTLT
jgi:hypothetical protein